MKSNKSDDNNNLSVFLVVTGATDGIGKSYAKQLAQQGLNIVLISRTQSKLDKVAAEIENEYKVKTKTVAVDFSGGSEIYEKIGKEIKGISIGILVNNVAVCYEYPEFFLQVEDGDKLFDQILRCNVASVVNMTKLVLPIMLTDQRGIIVNIASISGKIPQPLLTVYSASKVNVIEIAILLFPIENIFAFFVTRHLLISFPRTSTRNTVRKELWFNRFCPDTFQQT